MTKRVRQVWERLRGRLSKRGIVSHVLAIVLIGIAVTAAFLIVASILQARSLALAEEERYLGDHYISFMASVADQTDGMLGLALAFGRNEAIQAAFAASDRAELMRVALPAWLEIEAKVGTSICQFHLPPATSLLRLHDIETFGDDLSDFRQSVVDTIALQQTASGLEWGRSGIAIRSVVPVWYGRDFAGSVEFGTSFDNAFLHQYTEDYAIEMEVYVSAPEHGVVMSALDATELPGTGGQIFRYASTLDTPLAVPEDAVARVIQTGKAEIHRFQHEGRPVAVYIGPISDYSHHVIGALSVAMARHETLGRIRQAEIINSATGLAALAVVGVIAYRSTKRLIEPVEEMSQSAQRVATGDLDVKIPVRRQNELGELANAFNTMIDGLKALLAQVSAVSQDLSGSGERLAVEMEEMNSSVEQVSIAVGELARGAGIQAVRVEEASHAMGQLAAATGQIAQNARSTGEVSARARAVVDDAREVSRKLGTRAQRIESVVVAVDKTADQTNLLALNASIEAARAGEAGVGFAVVAQEVRRLAESSAELVSEIAELSQAISGDLAMVWEKMDAAQAAVDETATLAQATAVATEEQESSSDAMVVAINEIATVAEQSAASTEEIAVTVEQQVSSLDHIAGAAQTLADLSRQLRESVARLEGGERGTSVGGDG